MALAGDSRYLGSVLISAKGLFNSVLYLELFFMRKKLFTQRISNVLHWPDLDKT